MAKGNPMTLRLTEEELAAIQARNRTPGETAKLKKLATQHKRRDDEHQEQKALFQWADYMTSKHPLLALVFAIPNGGDRHPAVAAKLKAEGVKPGVPDLFLPVAKGIYHGLFIEMKAAKGRPSNVQKEWLRQLAHQGFKTAVCYGWEEAKEVIEEYLLGDALDEGGGG